MELRPAERQEYWTWRYNHPKCSAKRLNAKVATLD